MLHFSRWKTTLILATALIICLFAVPNFFPEKTVQSWPKWAQRHIVLGLDLQGGSHILLEVDTNAVRREKLQNLREDVARVVRENRLGAAASAAIRGNSVEFRIRDGADPQLALTKFRELSQLLGGILGTSGQRTVDVVDTGNGLFRFTPTEPALIERIRQAVDQSIQIVERRVNELGTVEPSIQRQGSTASWCRYGLAGSCAVEELLGKRPNLLSAGRSVDAARTGFAWPIPAILNCSMGRRQKTSALSDREAPWSFRART